MEEFGSSFFRESPSFGHWTMRLHVHMDIPGAVRASLIEHIFPEEANGDEYS